MISINDRINNHRVHNPVLRFIRGDYNSVRIESGLIDSVDGVEEIELSPGTNNCIEDVFGDSLDSEQFDKPIDDDEWKKLCDTTIFS